MKTIALTTLEKSINQYLSLGEETQRLLQQLEGKTVAFHIKRPKLTLFYHFHERRVQIDSFCETDIDVHIYTSLFQLVRLRMQKNANLVGDSLHIEGDVETAKLLNELFFKNSIDWEEHLSQFIGDVTAYKLGSFVRNRKRNLSKIKEDTFKNVGEYLQEEKELLAHPNALNCFHSSVDELALDVDRLEAKVQQLTKPKED